MTLLANDYTLFYSAKCPCILLQRTSSRSLHVTQLVWGLECYFQHQTTALVTICKHQNDQPI